MRDQQIPCPDRMDHLEYINSMTFFSDQNTQFSSLMGASRPNDTTNGCLGWPIPARQSKASPALTTPAFQPDRTKIGASFRSEYGWRSELIRLLFRTGHG